VRDFDCPGTRTCGDTLTCEPAPCAGDRFDGAVEPPLLARRTYTSLVLCDGTDDLYRVALPAREGIRVVLRHAAGQGDLGLTVEGDGVTLGVSDHGYGLEVVGVEAAWAPQDLVVRVSGRAGASVEYALSLERLTVDDCAADALEGLLGNDDAAHATPVRAGAHTLRICPGDEDWLSVELAAGAVLQAQVWPGDAAPDTVQLELRAPHGGVIAAGALDGAWLTASGQAEVPGTYMVRVRAPQAPTKLDLDLHLAVDPAAHAADLACAHPLALAPEQPTPLPFNEPVSRLRIPCGPLGPALDAVFRFELDAAAQVSLRVDGVPEAAIALRDLCTDPGSEAACVQLHEGRPLEALLQAGVWFAIVKTVREGHAALSLSVAPPCAVDADCEAPSVCAAGLCAAPCLHDADCPGAQTCIPGSGHCEEPERCVDDQDCLGARGCELGDCVEVECQQSEECEALCVDRRCGAAPPQQCAQAGDCPGAQICNEVGACVPDGPCTEDAECLPGAPRCDDVAGACVVCLSDDDCGAAGACAEGLCSYDGACAGDEDCPGERTCALDEAQCMPAACEGDSLDALPLPRRLRARTYTNLVLCDGSLDLYRVHVPPGEGLQVLLRHSPDAGDLALSLRRVEAPPGLLGESDGRFGVETVDLPPAPNGRDVDVAVTGQPGTSAPYSLTIERVPGG